MINLVVCVSFTIFAFFCARPPTFLYRISPRIFRRIDKTETISICFCAPAKTQALGIPLIAAMYSSADDQTRALIQVPMILYTAEQIVVGQALIWYFKRWLAKDKTEDVEISSIAETPMPHVNASSETAVEDDKGIYK
jgi:sodium/bile acid cotransporter 7